MTCATEADVFCEATFRSLLDEVRSHGYAFARFDRHDTGRRFYLRHDVDISPVRALRLATIEHECGVTANYFFQLGADTYNLLDRCVLESVERVRDLGHLVGLHIDNDLLTTEQAVAATIGWFRHIADVADVVSFHRPAGDLLGRQFGTFISAYDRAFFSRATYASDSRRDPGFLVRVRDMLQQGVSPIQLLLHPVWWGGAENLEERIVDRRARDARRYLSRNFPKVFGGDDDDWVGEV